MSSSACNLQIRREPNTNLILATLCGGGWAGSPWWWVAQLGVLPGETAMGDRKVPALEGVECKLEKLKLSDAEKKGIKIGKK